MLNHLLAHALANGDLDFLLGRCVAIELSDMQIRFHLMLDEGGFASASTTATPDVLFRGDAHTFLLLATQREDADTLFFQRRLRIEGDTAVGLHLKNFVDSLGEAPLPTPARLALARFTDVYERRCLSSR